MVKVPQGVQAAGYRQAVLPARDQIPEQTAPAENPTAAPETPVAPVTENQVQVNGQAAVKHPGEANVLVFPASERALEVLKRHNIPLDAATAAKLINLDRRLNDDSPFYDNKLIDFEELDINGDGEVTRKEIQSVLSRSLEELKEVGRYRLQTQPTLLPNLKVEGVAQIQINNGEMVRHPGVLFDSDRVVATPGNGELNLGQGDLKGIEAYAYCNFQPLRETHGTGKQPDGKPPIQQAYYVYEIDNPAGNGDLLLDISGSGLVNKEPDASQPGYEAQMAGRFPKSMTGEQRALIHEHRTRLNDADAQDQVLRQDDPLKPGQVSPNPHQLSHRSVTVPEGKSIMVYTTLPMKSGVGDLRSQFQVRVVNQNELAHPRHFRAAVVTELPAAATAQTGVLGDKTGLDPATFSPELQSQLSAFVEPDEKGRTEFLKQASDLSSPGALAADMRTHQLASLQQITRDFQGMLDYLDGKAPKPPESLKGQASQLALLKTQLKASHLTAAQLFAPHLSVSELGEYTARAERLIQDLEHAPGLDEGMMNRVRAWNADMKTIQLVLDHPDLKGQRTDAGVKSALHAFTNPFWSTQLSLGRVDSVLKGNVFHSTIDN
ncbi:MAG: hypothetical protein ACAI44_38275 [Candidatus Sericytochromatia bacterium]